MMYLFAFLAAVGVAFLVWLVVTTKIHLPLLADIGLSTMALGGIAWIDSAVLKENLTPTIPLFVIGLGLAMICMSRIRVVQRQRRRIRRPGPPEIDGRHLHNITGGKHEHSS